MLHSIRGRLLGLVLAAAIPFVALIGLAMSNQWHAAQADAAQRALVQARLIASHVDDHLGNLDNLLAGLSHAVSTDPADAAKNDALLQQVKAELPDFISNIIVVGLDGANIGSSAHSSRSRPYFGDRAYFRAVLAGKRFAVGDVVRSRPTNEWLVSVARPIEDARGNLTGVLAVGTRLARFQHALMVPDLPSGTVVRVVNDKGIVVARSEDANAWIGRDLSASENVAAHLAAREATGTEKESGDVERIIASSAATRVPWLVSVGVPRDVATAAITVRIRWGLLYAIASLTAGFFIAWTLSGRIARPLRRLSDDAAILAAGNLTHRTELHEDGELGVLAGAFNAMAVSLQNRDAEARRSADEMREAKETLASVIDASPAAIVCTGPDRRVSLWNSAAERIFGYTAAETIGQRPKMIPSEGLPESGALFERASSGEPVRGVEVKRMRKDGSRVDVRLATTALRNPDQSFRGMTWVFEDISDYKNVEQQLRRLALFDPLTSLPNRLCLQKDMGRAIGHADGDTTLAVAVFDLDGFKHVNDTLGHSTGDELLVEVGQRLTHYADDLDQTCHVYRLGGDEFVLLVEDCADPVVATTIVAGILEQIAIPFEIGGHLLHVGGSAGIAIANNDGTSADELIANADLALYQAKAAGGRVYRMFVPTMRATAHAKHDLERELRRAYANGEFELYFQPQVRLRDEAVLGAEALLRWNHPERGLIAPDAFIHTLEESPIAPDVGRWIVNSACQQLMEWRAAGLNLGRISVNLFPGRAIVARQLQDIEDVLASTGLPPESLELEITENFVLKSDDAPAMVQRLHSRGIKLAFDDFGTGYASLSNLMMFPVSRIKIDRSFLTGIAFDSEKQAIVRALIGMARNLKLAVTAEGIEYPAQAKFLIEENCEEGQGFMYCHPLPAAEFAQYLATKSLEAIVAEANSSRRNRVAEGAAREYRRRLRAERR